MTDFRILEPLITLVIDHGFKLHDTIGPGLLETAYEAFLAASLRDAGVVVEQQVPMAAAYRGTTISNAFRVDLLVGNILVVELKSVDRVVPVHSKQVLTYLRLLDLPVGLLMNFGEATFKSGVSRIINNRHSYRRDTTIPHAHS